MGSCIAAEERMLALRSVRCLSVTSYRGLATGGDAIKDLFAEEFSALSARLEAARNKEMEVPENVYKQMQEEAAAAKARAGLTDMGEVALSKKLKIGDL